MENGGFPLGYQRDIVVKAKFLRDGSGPIKLDKVFFHFAAMM